MEISLDRVGDAGAVLIAGPTASGKSKAALRLAEAAIAAGRGALVTNADSMQVYDALRILTARPSEADERLAPHRLYGHVRAEMRYSVGAWLRDAKAVLDEAAAAGRLAIVVGGTGLYFKALTEGLAETPDVPAEIRAGLAARLDAEGAAALHADLAARDPASAAEIRPSDPQRVLRALEVLEATGMPLRNWRQLSRASPVLSAEQIVRLVLEPDRPALYRRIEERFDRMAEMGAVEEVRALLDLGLDPNLPAMKAIGVRELAAFIRGETSLKEAIAQAKMETRRYAKRQTTWFRHQTLDWQRIAA